MESGLCGVISNSTLNTVQNKEKCWRITIQKRSARCVMFLLILCTLAWMRLLYLFWLKAWSKWTVTSFGQLVDTTRAVWKHVMFFFLVYWVKFFPSLKLQNSYVDYKMSPERTSKKWWNFSFRWTIPFNVSWSAGLWEKKGFKKLQSSSSSCVSGWPVAFFCNPLKKTHRCESFHTTTFIMSLVFTEHGVIHSKNPYTSI